MLLRPIESLFNSEFISLGALFKPLNSALSPDIVSCPFEILRTALSTLFNSPDKLETTFDASAFNILKEFFTSSTLDVPFRNPFSLFSKSVNGTDNPESMLLFVDLNCSIFCV